MVGGGIAANDRANNRVSVDWPKSSFKQLRIVPAPFCHDPSGALRMIYAHERVKTYAA
jgi:hypothetical protein